ncbi:MAG: hypothetical protein RIQ81_1401 [Pseudomonadota bacterium]
MIARKFSATLRFFATVSVVVTTFACGEDSDFVDKELQVPDAQAPLSGEFAGGMDAVATQVSGLDPIVDAVPTPPVPPTTPPAVIPVPTLVVDTSRIVLTTDQSKIVPVSINDGNGNITPADQGDFTVVSNNPAIVTVVPGSQPGEFSIIPVGPGQTSVTIKTPDDVKTIPIQVAPGVPVIRLGVNFEDIPDGGDFDYNDAVFCFSGKFAHDNQSVVSLEEQVVRINVTNRSGCDHFIYIAVVDTDGTRRALPQFRSRTQPALDLRFYPGSRLEVKMHVADQCLANASWVGLGGKVQVPGPTFGRPLVEVLNDVCRTNGN